MNNRARVASYVELTKPRITAMVLVTTAAGYLAAADSWRAIDLLATIVTTGLLAGGTASLNQWYERDTDAAMRRTCHRPIPSGRLPASHAFWFGIALTMFGLGGLVIAANALAAIAGLVTFASYLLVYTPLKRRSPVGVFVGAFAGAMPPVIGSAAASGRLESSGLALFAVLFVWQIPHVYAIAMMYRDDYERGGLKMLPLSDRSRQPGGHIAAWSIALVATSVAPAAVGTAGSGYLLCAIALGLVFAYHGIRLWIEPSVHHARRVLLASVAYLPAVLVMTGVDALTRSG